MNQAEAAPSNGPQPPATLVARDVTKSFGAVEVLAGIDLWVGPGEVLALLGPSGCGKSTLLRVLAGFEQADGGVVELGGRPVRGPSPERGMVAQAGTLFPWLSLRKNLGYGPRQAGRKDVDRTVDELVSATGLSGFDQSLPRELSGGMRQRGAIAQVLANRPPVLLLDEPFGALDAQTRLRMHEWFRSLLAERPTTVVLVTHDVDEALLLGDRVGLLSARPCRVVDSVDVDLGDQRGRDTLSDPGFVQLKAEVLGRVLSA